MNMNIDKNKIKKDINRSFKKAVVREEVDKNIFCELLVAIFLRYFGSYDNDTLQSSLKIARNLKTLGYNNLESWKNDNK